MKRFIICIFIFYGLSFAQETFLPAKSIKISPIQKFTVLPDSLGIAFISVNVDSVNIYYSTDSLNWVVIKKDLHLTTTGSSDTVIYWWRPEKGLIYGDLFIKVDEDIDTTTVFPVKRGSDLIDIGMSAPTQSGYQNALWYSNPIMVNGKLICLSVKTDHWGWYGVSHIYLYTYDNSLRSWQLSKAQDWSADPYYQNSFYADSGNVSLFYFGGEAIVFPGNYYYIQIAVSGNDFVFHTYTRAINTAPLQSTDPSTYPISDGRSKYSLQYLGRNYVLAGNKLYADSVLYADFSGSLLENLPNLGIYAYDNRIMLTEYYHGNNTVAQNYALKALPVKSDSFASDIIKLGENIIARRDYFRGIYPKARR
ncbi:MAG: hypothetical protein Q8940_07180 [Bacteroidota bacterium]|nr:hypothetical protein [Bacteroidota bacterium]